MKKSAALNALKKKNCSITLLLAEHSDWLKSLIFGIFIIIISFCFSLLISYFVPSECMGFFRDIKEASQSLKEASISMKETASVLEGGASNLVKGVKEVSVLKKDFPKTVFFEPTLAPNLSIDLSTALTTASILGGGAALVKFLPAKYKAVGSAAVLGSGVVVAMNQQNLKHTERMAAMKMAYELEARRVVNVTSNAPGSLDILSPLENDIWSNFKSVIEKYVQEPGNITDYTIQTIWLIDLEILFVLFMIVAFIIISIINNPTTFKFLENRIIPMKYIPWFKQAMKYRLFSTQVVRALLLSCQIIVLWSIHGLCYNLLEVLKMYFSDSE